MSQKIELFITSGVITSNPTHMTYLVSKNKQVLFSTDQAGSRQCSAYCSPLIYPANSLTLKMEDVRSSVTTYYMALTRQKIIIAVGATDFV
jgi:hypothetical protein